VKLLVVVVVAVVVLVGVTIVVIVVFVHFFVVIVAVVVGMVNTFINGRICLVRYRLLLALYLYILLCGVVGLLWLLSDSLFNFDSSGGL